MSIVIGVSGASGHVGGAAIRELVEKKKANPNIRIVAISRSGATKPIAGADESRAGDANDRASLEVAYKGVDRVFIVISSDLTPGVRFQQMKNAIDAAVAAKVKHIAVLGIASARKVPLGNLIYEYYETEQHLIKTVPNDGWTILRMAYFAESIGNTFLGPDNNSVGYSETARINIVSREDVGAAGAAVLTSDGHNGATYNITGPHAFTLAELSAVAQKVKGQPSTVKLTTSEAHKAALASYNLPPNLVNLIDSLIGAHAAGSFDITTGDVERLLGRKPKTFESVLASGAKGH